MIKTALIIVPHPDDEINIGGGIFTQLADNGIDTTVLICSNGDYYHDTINDRYKEALKVKDILRYNKLIYLGYGDNYKDVHIYASSEITPGISTSGYRETHAPDSTKEFCFERSGIHHLYTRDNFKNDIKNVIIDIKADFIVCVDLDKHPDHRCVSLLFEEGLKEILVSNNQYRPIVFKTFAYEGVWFGIKDYFSPIKSRTQKKEKLFNDIALYNWSDRISVETPSSNTSIIFWKSRLFKALRAYKTQNTSRVKENRALNCFLGIANPDAVFWHRSTLSLTYNAKVNVSSGCSKYLNDFKLTELNDVRPEDFWKVAEFWQPDTNDREPYVEYVFNECFVPKVIEIYQNSHKSIKTVEVYLDDNYVGTYNCDRLSHVRIAVDNYASIRKLKIVIKETYSTYIEVGEIEVYDTIETLDMNNLPFNLYSNNDRCRKRLLTYSMKVIFIIFEYYNYLIQYLKFKKKLKRA